MKIFIILICVFALNVSSGFSNVNTILNNDPTEELFKPDRFKIVITIEGEIGIKRRDCAGIGLSCLEFDIDVTLRNGAPQNKPGSTDLDLEVKNSGTLSMWIYTTKIRSEKTIEVSDITKLHSSICKALGYREISIMPGNYPISKDANGAFYTEVKIASK
jgi:hypothetical protein